MSAYGHDMEREFSAQSLPSRGASEMGSRYSTELGIYMSSFAATVFISGLVTVGVSLLSLVVALTVMLRSCESRNSGVLELYGYRDDYDYCRNFALHAELNSLGQDFFPETCKDVGMHYLTDGQYRRDLNITVGIAENFFSGMRPQNDGRDIVLMDVDDFLASGTSYAHWINEDSMHDGAMYAEYLKRIFLLKLFLKLQSDGWPLILFSRKPEKFRNATVGYLQLTGPHNWSSLIMRTEDEMRIDFQEFSSRQRTTLQRDGFRIIALISSHIDALSGPCFGCRIFKIPNPIFPQRMEDRVENQIKRS